MLAYIAQTTTYMALAHMCTTVNVNTRYSKYAEPLIIHVFECVYTVISFTCCLIDHKPCHVELLV